MSKVSIRTKSICKGTKLSIYLEFNPPYIDLKGAETRYEFLNIEKYANPANEVQMKHNAMIDEIAETIRCDRYIQIIKKDYSSIIRNNLDESFLDYFIENCEFYGIKYQCCLKHFRKYCNDKCIFRDITVSYCEKFGRFLLHENGWCKKTKLSTNTAAAYFNVFLSVVNMAYKDGIIKVNVASEVNRIKWKHDQPKEYLNPKEISRIEKITRKDLITVKQACLLSIYTGLRRADVLNLRWSDVHIKSKQKSSLCITICKTKVPFSIPLSSSARELLLSIPQKDQFVFPDLTISTLIDGVKELIKEAKIEKHITFHCFRHTFAMTLLNKGVDIYTISKLLGHQSVANTQVYAKLSNEQLRHVVSKL